MPSDAPVRNVLTTLGSQLITEALNEKKAIIFVRAEVGDSDTYKDSTLDQIAALSSLGHKIANAKVARQKVSNGNFVVTVEYENTNQTVPKYIKEIGLYAKKNGQNNSQAILFTYLTFGDHPDYVQDISSMIVHRVYDLPFAFDGTLTVEISVSPSTLVMFEDTRLDASTHVQGDENKVPRISGDGKLHFDITGSATSIGGHAAGDFLLRSDVSTDGVLWFDQPLRQDSSPTFSGLTVNGYIDGAKFR